MESMVSTSPTGIGVPQVFLRADKLTYAYSKRSKPAVYGVSILLKEGEIYGLLGPNGAGKTTTLSILSTLLRPQSGELEVAGVDGIGTPRKIRPLIGLVPQELALYPSLTACENLAYFGRLHGLWGKRLSDRVRECLIMVGLQEHGDRRIETFSGGMKRRINLAAGVIHRPRLLFLDEPTVGIDAQSRHTILENLQKLQQEGMTMIYTTHYMEEVQQLCSRIAVMDHGRIIAEGSPADLLKQSPGCCNLEELFLQLTGTQLRDG